jgi:hypothetical protein
MLFPNCFFACLKHNMSLNRVYKTVISKKKVNKYMLLLALECRAHLLNRFLKKAIFYSTVVSYMSESNYNRLH